MTKIIAAIAALKTAVADSVNETSAVFADTTATVEAKLEASKNLQALGKINTSVNRAVGRIEKTISRLAPKPKKVKDVPVAETPTSKKKK